jgi:hypothetical protein
MYYANLGVDGKFSDIAIAKKANKRLVKPIISICYA